MFLLSTLAVACMLATAILAMQAGMAVGFGALVLKAIASRHTVIEGLGILFTVAFYAGFISIEKLFDRYCFQKALAVITLVFAITAAGCAAAGVHASFLVFGFVSGVFLRILHVLMKSRLVGAGIAIACFAAVGFVSFQAHPSTRQYALC